MDLNTVALLSPGDMGHCGRRGAGRQRLTRHSLPRGAQRTHEGLGRKSRHRGGESLC